MYPWSAGSPKCPAVTDAFGGTTSVPSDGGCASSPSARADGEAEAMSLSYDRAVPGDHLLQIPPDFLGIGNMVGVQCVFRRTVRASGRRGQPGYGHPGFDAAKDPWLPHVQSLRSDRESVKWNKEIDRMAGTFRLQEYGITVDEVHHNLSPSSLYEHAIRYEKDASIADNGGLVAYSGVKTGRSPKDKRVVRHPESEADVWWGPVNIPLEPHSFDINRERAIDYLNTRERLYCFDGFAGWDPKYRIKVRVICSRPYHALFMHTMLIRPTKQELADFGKPDFLICNAGAFPANRLTAGVESKTSICLSLEDRELIILGTEYAGEMKKGVFTVANYFAPKRGLLSMHCSATADRQTGRRRCSSGSRVRARPPSPPIRSGISSATMSTSGATTGSSTSTARQRARSSAFRDSVFQARPGGSVASSSIVLSS